MMFRVKRPELISRIWELSRDGSVLITGSPGVGKSWIIAQVIRHCKREKRPHLPLIAEDFDINSVEELTAALGFKTDVLSFLQSLGNNPVLVVDGLDALRSEMSQRAFRELIRQVTLQVSHCSIIASIRTFDLQQSELLQQLFSSAGRGSKGRRFTEVKVPPFSEADLATTLTQVPQLEPLVRDSTEEFRELLRNPFNLQLAVQLVQGGTALEELSVVQSQVQLLDKHWRLRIETPTDGPDRKALLRRVVRAMMDRKALSVPGENAYAQGLGHTLKALQSDEILREGVTGRISFTHNMYFDYAVSRLVLDEETIFRFINEDTSRTIFFRPSLSYFFHRLWFRDQELFWRVAFSFFGSQDLPERARVVPAVTIYEAATGASEIDPLLDSTSEAAKKGIAGTLRAVQAFGGLQSRRRQLWLTALSRIADRPDVEFVNEYVALINIASDSASASDEKVIGAVARKLLRWMWNMGSELGRDEAVVLAGVGAARVFPVVMKFYHSEPAGSRQVVLEVLNRFGSPVSGSHEAFWLANEIKSVIQNDPELAIEVYRRTFSHKEMSEERTPLGGSIIISLVSTRKQDFSSALYGLERAFRAFLESTPVEAAVAAIESVNAEIDRERPSGRGDETIEEFTFQYEDQQVRYRSDHSEIWDSGVRLYGSLKLLDAALNYAAERLLAEPNDDVGRVMIFSIASRSTYAVAWKRLLEKAETNCRALYLQVFGLLTIPEFISAPETTIAVGNVLKSAYEQGLVGDSDAQAIERAVSHIPAARVPVRYEKPESIRNRLLMCIPQQHIRSEELKALAHTLVEAEEVRENKPYYRVSGGFRPFSTEDWLREEGVDTSRPENAEILEALKPLQEFEHKYLNATPSADECAGIEPHIQKLNALLSEPQPDGVLGEQARGALCATAETVLKNPELSQDGSVVQLCRGIVLKGTGDHSPEFNPEYHLPFDMPSWGSPSPRIEAAQGLSHFLWNWGLDADVIGALQLLSRDKVPAVRFQVAAGLLGFYKHNAPEQFWAFAEEMLRKEQTTGVMLALIENLGRIAGKEPDRVVSLLRAAIERGLPATERHELARNLLRILAGLYVSQNNSSANQQLLMFEADPIRYHTELSEEILTTTHYLSPSDTKERESRVRAQGVIQRAVIAVYKGLQALADRADVEEKGEAFGHLLRLLDNVVFQLYIALDVNRQLRDGAPGLTGSARKEHYFELKPIIELLTVRSEIPGRHYLAPDTAHHLMETLNGVLTFDPGPVITYSAAVCRASSALNYQFDPMAIAEMVKLVERVLADYKQVLRDTSIANALGDMLDIFVRAGWPQAMHLTFRLDKAIR